MADSAGGIFWDLRANTNQFKKDIDKAFSFAKKKGAGLVWDTSSFVAGLKMTKKEFQAFGKEVDRAKDKYTELLDLQRGLQESGIWKDISAEAKESFATAVESAKEEAKLYDRTLKHMGRGQKLKSLLGGLGKVFGEIFSVFRKHTAQAGSEFGGFLKRLLGITGIAVLLRKAFSYIREGMQNLYKADAETKASVDTLRNALAGLKNALASAFAPILNAVAPILSKFIGMLTSAANAVASFISALLGKKFVVQAGAVSDGLDGIGSSASDANDSAKELQRTLMGFDKINKLDSNKGSGSGSGGGGGGGGSGVGGGFDLVPVSDEANQWADKFRESWENADFYWLGELLANKFNDALEKIPWEKIQENARKLAGSLATFLNGFIENADWDLVGSTIAQGLNTGVYFAQTFVHTFNWKALGDAVANTINGFVRDTDWSAIGDTIGTSIYGLLTSINTFLKKTDWSAIGSAIVETITSINWVKLFTGAVELIGNVAGAIFDMLSGAISTARDNLKKWVESGKIWDDLFEIGSKVIEVGIELFKKGWTTITEFIGLVEDVLKIGIELFKNGWDSFKKWLFGGNKDNGDETVNVGLQKNSSNWVADAWTALTKGNQTYTTTQGIKKNSSTWVADAWTALTKGNQTYTTSQSIVKAKKWTPDAWTALTTKSHTTKTTAKLVKGNVNATAWSVLNASSTGTLSRTVNLTLSAKLKGGTAVGDAIAYKVLTENTATVAYL